jgi:hypothetical protein
VTALSVLAVACGLLLWGDGGADRRTGSQRSAFIPSPATASAAEVSPWQLAARTVTEDRGEPTGRQAKVAVPSQLRHYSDTRRFLAIQVAEWREHRVSTPHDYASLAGMIRAGELVEVPTVGESYLLFGVGGSADRGPFTHFDESDGESVALLDDAELAAERQRAEESSRVLRGEIDTLRRELDSLGRKERTRRAELLSEVARKEKALKGIHDGRETLDANYGDAARRARLSTERETLASLAADFRGRAYDLADSRSRLDMKVRMLSHLRPEALAVLRELSDSYQRQFGRPLPVTSLVRPDEYQHRLSRTNANATRIDTPPHSTGLAFDILYRHMTADEQAHVMADIARLRDEGRVEALRENRDHFHVFAFIDGKRPGEDLISRSLGHSASAAKPRADEHASARTARKAAEPSRKKAAAKQTPKRAGNRARRGR